MADKCGEMHPEELAAWIDGEARPGAAATVAAHVAGCPHCAAHAERLRVQKGRLGRYRAATTPADLPDGLWERALAAMDATDRRTTNDERPTRGTPRWSLVVRRSSIPLPAFAGLTALLVATALLIADRALPRPVAPLAQLAARPMPERVVFLTADADRAASWLGRELGAAFPPVSLTLAGGRLVGATALPESRCGVLVYQGEEGTRIALHIYLASRMTLPALPRTRYEGTPFQIRAGDARQATLIAWQDRGRTFVAAARLSPGKLLPYAREMDRHCRRRQ